MYIANTIITAIRYYQNKNRATDLLFPEMPIFADVSDHAKFSFWKKIQNPKNLNVQNLACYTVFQIINLFSSIKYHCFWNEALTCWCVIVFLNIFHVYTWCSKSIIHCYSYRRPTHRICGFSPTRHFNYFPPAIVSQLQGGHSSDTLEYIIYPPHNVL